MRKALAVAGRELRERWLFFPAGLVLGFVPLALPAFGLSTVDSGGVGLLVALVLGGAAAVVAGATMLARDAASGRLGFLFSRPLSWPQIWGGKWLAALVLGGLSGLLAAIPWMAAYPSPRGGPSLGALLDVQGALFALSVLGILVGIANLGAAAFLSRSSWVALDLAGVVVAVWGVRRYVGFLVCGASAWGETLLLALPAVSLLLASAAQVAVGRTDLHRAHRALSLTFWGCVAAMLLAAAGHLDWMLAAGPGELRPALVSGIDASRRWVQVAGASSRSRCIGADLLLDLRSGAYLPLQTSAVFREMRSSPRALQLEFAERAELAARWVTASNGRATGLELLDLSGAAPRLSRVTLEGSAAPRWSTLRLSPSGATALVVGASGAASLFDTRSGRALATVPVPPGSFAANAAFTSETEARVWLSPDDKRSPGRVLDLAAGGRAVWTPFAVAVVSPGSGAAGAYAVVPLASGRRVLSFDDGVRLRDGKTGALLASLVEGGRTWGVGLLVGGRIAVAATRGGHGRLEVFDREGVRHREVDLAAVGPVAGLSEIAPGRIAVGIGPVHDPRETVVVDADEGRVVGRIEGLRPAWGWTGRSSLVAPPVGLGLFTGRDGQLVVVDPATGERRIVAGSGAPKGERLALR